MLGYVEGVLKKVLAAVNSKKFVEKIYKKR